jgi:photosystem II stability/assembly factor-like uncharacterized protein
VGRKARLGLAGCLLGFVALAPVGAPAASPEVGSWTTHGPHGGYPEAVAIAPSSPNVMYAGAAHGGIFRSANWGGNWRYAGGSPMGRECVPGHCPPLAVHSLAVHPTDPRVVFAGLATGIWMSTDDGVTWNKVGPSGAGCQEVMFDPRNPLVVYAAEGINLLKSTDGGQTWETISQFANGIEALAVDPVATEVLFVGTSEKIYRSGDGGATWVPVMSLPGEWGRAFAIPASAHDIVYAAHDTGVLKSTDGGFTWVPADTGLPGYITSLAVRPSNPDVVFAAFGLAGSRDGVVVYRTVDGGDSWVPSSAGLPDGRPLMLVLASGNRGFLYASIFGHGLYVSRDGGDSWAEDGDGLIMLGVGGLAIDPVTPQVVLAGRGMRGLFRSTNSGRSWSRVQGDISDRWVGSVDFNQKDHLIVYAGTDRGVFKSVDGGVHWTPTSLEDGAGEVAVSPSQPSVLYAGSPNTVYRSGDGGETWHQTDIYFDYDRIEALAVDPNDPDRVYLAAEVNGVHITEDGGDTWRWVVGSPWATSIVVDPTDPATLYAGAVCFECDLFPKNGVFKSTDRGETWTQMNVGLPEEASVSSVAVDPSDPQIVYAGGNDPGGHTDRFGVYRSTDGGSSWSPFNEGLRVLGVYALAVTPSGSVVHAGTDAGAFEYVFP